MQLDDDPDLDLTSSIELADDLMETTRQEIFRLEADLRLGRITGHDRVAAERLLGYCYEDLPFLRACQMKYVAQLAARRSKRCPPP